MATRNEKILLTGFVLKIFEIKLDPQQIGAATSSKIFTSSVMQEIFPIRQLWPGFQLWFRLLLDLTHFETCFSCTSSDLCSLYNAVPVTHGQPLEQIRSSGSKWIPHHLSFGPSDCREVPSVKSWSVKWCVNVEMFDHTAALFQRIFTLPPSPHHFQGFSCPEPWYHCGFLTLSVLDTLGSVGGG